MCHDRTTLLAVKFPYAAPQPASCAKPITISPLTTLLVAGAPRGLTVAQLLESLNLPAGFALLTTDTLGVSSGREGGEWGRAGRQSEMVHQQDRLFAAL